MANITLLSPVSGLRPAKTFERLKSGELKTTSYPDIRNWWYLNFSFDNIVELGDILTAAEEDGHYCAIRGQIKEGIDITKPVLKRLSEHEDGGIPAFMEHPQGQQWIMIDIDNYRNPFEPPKDKEEMEAFTYWMVCAILPECFWDVVYWYQWSSSMAVKDDWSDLKIHLWFFLKTPLTDTVLRQWAKTVGIDDRVYVSVQANYIAGPEFIGMADPLLGCRSGLCCDWATKIEVDLGYEYVAADRFNARSDELVKLTQALWKKEGKKFFEVTATMSPPMQRIAEIGVEGRLHLPILRSANSWIVCCGDNPDREAWKALVRERVQISGHKESKHRASDEYLNMIWRSALSHSKPFNPNAPRVPKELIENRNNF